MANAVEMMSDQGRTIDPAEEEAFLDAIDRWIERSVRPVVLHHDHNDIWPEALVHEMAEMGLFGATIGQEYGGLGLPATTYAKIVMRISSYWMALSGIFNSHLIMAAAVERFGTAEQKTRWLPKFATGEIRGGLEADVRLTIAEEHDGAAQALRRGEQHAGRDLEATVHVRASIGAHARERRLDLRAARRIHGGQPAAHARVRGERDDR